MTTNYEDILGKTYGDWRVASIRAPNSRWPWAWVVNVKNPAVQARMSVKGVRDGSLNKA